MNGSPDTPPAEPTGLQLEVKNRETWFYECQLRSLNYWMFYSITELDADRTANEPFPDKRIDLISKDFASAGPMGSRMKSTVRVYLDDEQPVWTPDEVVRRNTFADTLIGRIDNWLGYKSGKKLADKLADLKKKYEASIFSSRIDLDPELNKFGRKEPAKDANSMGCAISRAMLAEAKPWLTPELYNAKNIDSGPIDKWIENLEEFIGNFEAELFIAVGAIPGQSIPADPLEGKAYRTWIKFMIEASSTRNVADSLKARMLRQDRTPDGKSFTYHRYVDAAIDDADADIQIQTAGYPMAPVRKFPFAKSVIYWERIFHKTLGAAYVNQPNSDMGLCHIMRTIYLLGTLPASLGADADLTWRKRAAPGDKFNAFFAKKAEDPALKDNEALRKRLQSAQTKLQVILDESAAQPRSAAPTFSPLAQEIVRQALHAFKFWMDEPLRVSSNDQLKKARKETGFVPDDDEAKTEMEYWSENHYIMFASSEFLAGQLWETDQFQPGKEFLAGDNNKSGILTGKERKERGKARVLKWLNNRLMFGWMEFHSSGYYREHLWSLLNLADFSLDREVREKAALAIDLLLFDVARYLHKGTMGAAGGRSQFKSKTSGWDNALCDVVEILFGLRGIFSDGDGQIGAAISSSTYQAPEVLLEIGTHPPETSFTDRSRVSVTFEEAPKYGIGYSKKSDQKDSVMNGYAPKRARYYPFIDSVNQAIARTHTDYGATEDDTVFWWGMSAFYNKQIVRATFSTVKKFALEKSPAFDKVATFIRLVSAYEKAKHGLIGGVIGSITGGFGAAAGAVIGFFEDDIFNASVLEAASDDLSVLIEGSTRTRANILSFRTPEIMLSSIQNFRTGQVNFQSSVCQASLNPSVNVFPTAGIGDFDISDLVTAIGGGLLGGALGTALGAAFTAATGGAGGIFIAGGAALGAAFATYKNEDVLKHQTLGIVNHDDGVGWWTGSWALPMIVQHDSAAILAYDFHSIQDLLAESGSHVWFPQSGFNSWGEMRTSAYDDANFPLLDIGHTGPKGFWLFGKIIHPAEGTNEPREAYIGVFSNQRPKWLDQGSDFYKRQIEEKGKKEIEKKQEAIDDLLDEIEDSPIGSAKARDTVKAAVVQAVDAAYKPNISREDWLKGATNALSTAGGLNVTNFPVLLLKDYPTDLANLEIDLKNLQRIWPDPLPLDYFAGRDWYVEGKNIWILQVGTKGDFGDFETFKDRVSKARIHLDDAGDMECSYDIPKADGSSERLSLAYGDGGQFSLNGSPIQTDFYPRFENPFLRGGKVEWGQREYVIEYRGKSLLHDFSDFSKPTRSENFTSDANDRNTVKALVIFLKTEDEEMDAFTVATASVSIGCSSATKDQVVAAGPAGEKTVHDAEWIFFESPSLRNSDMTVFLSHPASSKGDETPHWKMSFRLRALMGDRSLRDCSLSFSYFEFEDEKRDSGPFPFSVSLSEWRPWEQIENNKAPSFWMVARHPDFTKYYYEYNDLVALDQGGRLFHRRLTTCKTADKGWFPITAGGNKGPDLTSWFSASAVSAQPGSLFLLIQSQGTLFANWPSPSGDWSAGWNTLAVYTYPDILGIATLGIPNTNAAQMPVALASFGTVVAVPSSLSTDGAEIFVLGGDGHFYSHPDWHPNDTGPWRKLDVSGFSPFVGADFVVVGNFLLVLASDRALWAAALDHSPLHRSLSWERVIAAGGSISHFTATCESGICQIVAATTAGGVWATSYGLGNPPAWVRVNLPGPTASVEAPLISTVPSAGNAQFFALGTDNKVYTISWESVGGWNEGLQWSAVEPASQGFVPRVTGGMAAISRVNGQIELFAQGSDNELFKAWWS